MNEARHTIECNVLDWCLLIAAALGTAKQYRELDKHPDSVHDWAADADRLDELVKLMHEAETTYIEEA